MLVAEKVAVMVREPESRVIGVTVTVHTEVIKGSQDEGDNVQVPVMISPGSDEVTATVPVGADFVPPACVSATLTSTVLPWPTTTELGARPTVVEVKRLFTVKVPVAVLVFGGLLLSTP